MAASNLKKWFTSHAAAAPAAPTFELYFAFASDPGCHRTANEDSVCCLQPRETPKGLLAAVADGMGGHVAGAEASSMAIRILSEKYFADSAPPQAALTRAFHAANAAIYKQSRDPGRRGMGTTCTALAILGGQAYCAHVGDSRLYLVRDGEIHQLTEDHSKAMELARQGVITPEEARRHPERNIIFRAFGRDPDLAVAAWTDPLALRAGDCFVLSSDGLHDLVSDAAIREAVVRCNPRQACDDLVGQARAAGGFDNITVIVGQVRPPVEGASPMPGGMAT
ncbi:MAG: PP2C family serine/threonine-protein phosphatase [Bryobacteraceae bacterium]